MISLAIPWLLLFLLFTGVILLYRKKWLACGCVITLILLLNFSSECIPLRFWPINSNRRASISVMCFNIKGTSPEFRLKAERIAKFASSYSPDILFVSEIKGKNKLLLDSMLLDFLPYTCYTRNSTTFFYSKYKLYGWKKLETDEAESSGACKCSAIIENDTIVLYGCHFASNNYTPQRIYITPDSINDSNDIFMYISNVKRASLMRRRQAEVVAADITDRKNPIILMGDLNDVGGSAAVSTLEDAGLADAWCKVGFGYGATIHYPLPYRIDHIMFSDGLKLLKIKVIDSEGLSDHDALYAEFEFNN